MIFLNSNPFFGLPSKKFKMNSAPLIVIVALFTISIVMQHGNAGKKNAGKGPTLSELGDKIWAIASSLDVICSSMDTATNHCCYNPNTLKMFCAEGNAAKALGIDTSTPGICDLDGLPCK